MVDFTFLILIWLKNLFSFTLILISLVRIFILFLSYALFTTLLRCILPETKANIIAGTSKDGFCCSKNKANTKLYRLGTKYGYYTLVPYIYDIL